MKKLFTIAALAVGLSGLTAHAQGSFIFGTLASYVWDSANLGGSNAAVRANTTVDVGFLLGTGTPAVDTATGLSVVPTNSFGQNSLFNNTTAWNALLNDPNFVVATNNGTSGTAGIVVGTTSAAGGIAYNAGGTFFINGTSASGGTITVMEFGWDAHYANPYLAQAAGAAVGWSAPFSYNYGSTSGTPLNFGSQGGANAKFGVWAPIPEPTSFALAGLGAAAMMIFRRRK